MDKVIVSCLITGLRPKVKQAIVQIIHKLTKQLKKYSKPVPNDQQTKREQHVSRIKEELRIMKAIHMDTVIMKALIMDFDEREKVLNNVHEPLEGKVIVKVATHKSVKDHVKKIRESYPDWQNELPKLLDLFGSQKKAKRKILNTSEIHHKKDPKTKKLLRTSNLPASPDTILKKTASSICCKKKMREGFQNSEEDMSEGELKKIKSCDVADDNFCVKESENSGFSVTTNFQTHAEVCRLSDLLQEETCSNSRISLEKESPTVESNLSKGEIFEEEDTFFFTKDKDFLKTKAVKTDPTESNLVPKWNVTNERSGGNRAERRAALLGQRNLKHKTKKSRTTFKSDFEPILKHPLNHMKKSKTTTMLSQQVSGESLHPSWEAKRNQRISVHTFQGKKTKFDDSESKLVSTEPQHQRGLKQNIFQVNLEPETKLHPSWEAKRKQNSSINSYQGKKVKFEDS